MEMLSIYAVPVLCYLCSGDMDHRGHSVPSNLLSVISLCPTLKRCSWASYLKLGSSTLLSANWEEQCLPCLPQDYNKTVCGRSWMM